jgi:hypothetical protein
MTNEKLKSLFARYRIAFDMQNSGVAPKQLPPSLTGLRWHELKAGDLIAHFKFMCEEAPKFVDVGQVPKAMRWLGFIQGVLWAESDFSLEELKTHSKP